MSNAIERYDVRLRNEGFADGSVRCQFDDLPPVTGHAVTARIRCSTPPSVGRGYRDRTDWWNYILTIPPPGLSSSKTLTIGPDWARSSDMFMPRS